MQVRHRQSFTDGTVSRRILLLPEQATGTTIPRRRGKLAVEITVEFAG